MLKGGERVLVEHSDEAVPVHISGYLSPLGMYGHFGAGRREFLAVKITPAGK